MVNKNEKGKKEALPTSDPPDGVRLSAAAAVADVPADAAGTSYGGVAPGRLSNLVRMATRAHSTSTPYLTYAMMASQEAARYVTLWLYTEQTYGTIVYSIHSASVTVVYVVIITVNSIVAPCSGRDFGSSAQQAAPMGAKRYGWGKHG